MNAILTGVRCQERRPANVNARFTDLNKWKARAAALSYTVKQSTTTADSGATYHYWIAFPKGMMFPGTSDVSGEFKGFNNIGWLYDPGS